MEVYSDSTVDELVFLGKGMDVPCNAYLLRTGLAREGRDFDYVSGNAVFYPEQVVERVERLKRLSRSE